jgi:DNA-binding MarR family transcriptional regulator
MAIDDGFARNVWAGGSHSIGRSVKIWNASSAGAGTVTDFRRPESLASGAVMPVSPESVIPAGLTGAQVRILLTLKPGEVVPMRSLAARLDYDASNLSTVVDRLTRRGAVERRFDPGDRRVKALVLTAEGERLRASFWRDVTEDPGPLAPLGESDLRTLTTLLNLLGPGAD